MRAWSVWVVVLVLCPFVARADVGKGTGIARDHAPLPRAERALPTGPWTLTPRFGAASSLRSTWGPGLSAPSLAAPIAASPTDGADDDDCDARASPATAAQASALADLRLSQLAQRRTAGFWLLGFGVLSAAAGGGLIGFGHDRESVLAAGITTVSFGVINAVLSLGLLDLSHARQRRILADRAEARDSWAALREAELIAQLQSGQFFALNTGLDVAYLTAGGMLCALAAVRGGNDRWELGAGLAVLGQALFLLVFDIVNWIDTSARVTALRNL